MDDSMMSIRLVSVVTNCFFFFFQAEDGIRDIGVTGVQTCALPIWPPPATTTRPTSTGTGGTWPGARPRPGWPRSSHPYKTARRRAVQHDAMTDTDEIGRASCRERV